MPTVGRRGERICGTHTDPADSRPSDLSPQPSRSALSEVDDRTVDRPIADPLRLTHQLEMGARTPAADRRFSRYPIVLESRISLPLSYAGVGQGTVPGWCVRGASSCPATPLPSPSPSPFPSGRRFPRRCSRRIRGLGPATDGSGIRTGDSLSSVHRVALPPVVSTRRECPSETESLPGTNYPESLTRIEEGSVSRTGWGDRLARP